MKVYWTPYSATAGESWLDIAGIEPMPMMKYLMADRKTAEHMKCPSVQDYFMNAFVIFAPKDYTLTVNLDGSISTEDMDQLFFDKYVTRRTLPDDKHRTISVEFTSLFFSKEPLQVELIQPPMEHGELHQSVRVIPGTFNIGRWIRPVTFGVEVVDGFTEVKIRRGDPLTCIRFLTNEKVTLERIENSGEIRQMVESCVYMKRYIPNLSLSRCYEIASARVSMFLSKFKKCPFRR